MLVLLPTGRDAELVCSDLRAAGIGAESCESFHDLIERIGTECGPLLLGEEALGPAEAEQLHRRLGAQPAWSELPVVLLLARESSFFGSIERLAVRRSTAALRRPVDGATLRGVVRAALEARRREFEVRDLLRRLRELALALTRAEERERVRIASILHDDLQQMLAYAKLRAQSAARSSEDDRLSPLAVEDLVKALSDAIEMARDLSHQLAPPLLHTEGLGRALAWLAGDMKKKHDLQVHLDIAEGCPAVGREVRAFAYQAARELLFNVAKHAGTIAARLQIAHRDGKVRIVVEDEGMGFEPEELRSRGGDTDGFGLFSIEQRAALLGGTFQVDSTVGKGSRFVLSLPCAHGEESEM